MKKLKIGIIGVGFIGQLHMDAARRVPGVEISAICMRDPEALQATCMRHCIPKGYTDWRELVRSQDVDVVHNCTPHALHDEINRAALENGKHVYCEKPLSASAALAREMLLLAQKQKLAHGLNHQYRLNAAVQEMRARLSSESAGRPLFVHGRYLQESAARASDWSHRMENTGIARALNDIGIHWTDTATHVLGQPIREVMADLHIHHAVRTDVDGHHHSVSTEDTGLILLHFEDGTAGALAVSKAANGHKNDLRLCVECDGYSMEWRQEEPDRLRLGQHMGEVEIFPMSPHTCQASVRPYVTLPAGHVMGWCDALANALRVFYQSIRDENYWQSPQSYATFEDGFHGMAFVEACLRSHRERRWTEVETL